MLWFRRLAAVLVLAAPGAAHATADGPDFWQVRNVAQNDVLNIRAEPNGRSAKIGEIPPDADGLTNFGCIGEMTYEEYANATEAEREAAQRRRWCRVMYKTSIGWVAGRFLMEGQESDRVGTYPLRGHAGTEWALDQLGGQKREARAYLAFRPGNKVRGNSGCNTYNGAFVQRGADLLIGDLALTRKACDGAKMRTEAAMMDILARARTILSGLYTMALLDRNGRVLAKFRRSDWD